MQNISLTGHELKKKIAFYTALIALNNKILSKIINYY